MPCGSEFSTLFFILSFAMIGFSFWAFFSKKRKLLFTGLGLFVLFGSLAYLYSGFSCADQSQICKSVATRICTKCTIENNGTVPENCIFNLNQYDWRRLSDCESSGKILTKGVNNVDCSYYLGNHSQKS